MLTRQTGSVWAFIHDHAITDTNKNGQIVQSKRKAASKYDHEIRELESARLEF